MKGNETTFWPAGWSDPSGVRRAKPRSAGLTMVIDKGLGLTAFRDLLDMAAAHMDVIKLGFGTSALYPVPLLRQKIELARERELWIMPGGTFFEIARAQSPVERYLDRLKAIGFNAVEISDGTLSVTREERARAVTLAKEAGFQVFTEFGKKVSTFAVDQDELLKTLDADLGAGADCVIVEARESGNVGVFNHAGNVDTRFLRNIVEAAGTRASRLIWEAPRKEQQVILLATLGWQVNLGNVAPEDVLAVETLRRGLRGDTTAAALEARDQLKCE